MSEKGEMVNWHKLCILICCIYHAQNKRSGAKAENITQKHGYSFAVDIVGEYGRDHFRMTAIWQRELSKHMKSTCIINLIQFGVNINYSF